jgi:hypothetical protein
MDINTAVAGPSTRAAHAYGACPGQVAGLTRVTDVVAVWPEPMGSGATKPFLRQRPRPLSTLDPQRASVPPRWSP